MVSPDFTVSDVLAWARTKPADETYNFCEPSQCAIAQFGHETNREYLVGVGDIHSVHRELADAAQDCANYSRDWTFGGLVKRLEALCPETAVTKSDWLAIDAYLTDDLVSA